MTHPNPNRRQALSLAAGGAALLAAPSLFAQDKFPSRPITLIAPWPAGGSSDGVIRAFANSASKALGVPVIVENKPGAGGQIGFADPRHEIGFALITNWMEAGEDRRGTAVLDALRTIIGAAR